MSDVEVYIEKEEKRITEYLKSLKLDEDNRCVCCKEKNRDIKDCCNLLNNNIVSNPTRPS